MKFYLTIACCLLMSIHAKSQQIDSLTAKEAFAIVSNRDTINTVLIDGRSDAMFAEKHIEGAINIDAFKDSLSLELSPYLLKNELIVYCSNHHRSEIIIEKLKELHYTGKIIFISDGINGWISTGNKTISS